MRRGFEHGGAGLRARGSGKVRQRAEPRISDGIRLADALGVDVRELAE